MEPAIEVQVDEAFARAVDVERVRQRVVQTLEATGWSSPVVVSITITDDGTVRDLNRDYLGIDAPTDVLAFSQMDGADMPAVEGLPHLGDVIVSYQRATAQAGEYGEPVHQELERLVVHGLHHLLGYDDRTEGERERMWEMQERILISTRKER